MRILRLPKRLHPLSRQKLSEILTRTGHQLTLDDYGHIVVLDQIARDIQSCEDPVEQSLINHPVPCGNIVLRKPSLGKLFWYNEHAIHWFRDDPSICDIVFAYLLSTENTPDAVADLVDRDTTLAKISKWAKSLTATENEFTKAINRVYPELSEDPEDTEKNVSHGPLLALLAKEYGETPDYWLWNASIDMIQAMLADYNARIDAEYKAQKRAQQRQGFHLGGSARPVPPPVTPTLKQYARLRDYCVKLERIWREDGRP